MVFHNLCANGAVMILIFLSLIVFVCFRQMQEN